MKNDCTFIRELVSLSLDGEEGRKEKSALVEHLRVCEECGKYLDIQKVLREKAREVPPVSAGEIEKRLGRVRPGREKEKAAGWIFWPSLKPAALGLVAVLLASTILFVAGKERMQTLFMARNNSQIIGTLPDEEREFLLFVEEESGEGEEDIFETLQEIDEMEEIFTNGKAGT
ncbi:MAG: hypothetical protein GTN70_09030 [Deltaproteobacteria bacterium]|nr:hypothetical protein [Deltaproteobacteria bacterium]NIS77921.1 hypothetical protein [Deltaproteobacteria bacterium]